VPERVKWFLLPSESWVVVLPFSAFVKHIFELPRLIADINLLALEFATLSFALRLHFLKRTAGYRLSRCPA
jgi:hypothetical protein